VWPAADVINLFAVAAVGALSADHLRRRGLAPAWAAFGALVVTIGRSSSSPAPVAWRPRS
jgi:hypothetical protein